MTDAEAQAYDDGFADGVRSARRAFARLEVGHVTNPYRPQGGVTPAEADAKLQALAERNGWA